MLGITTYIAAQGFRRELGYLLPLLNAGNLNLSLPSAEDEVTINPADLLQSGHGKKGFSLPDTIPPSFRTCNIARKYALVLQMGVSASPSLPPEMIQLTVDVQVFSGFKPPPELIPTASQPPPPAPPPDGKAADGAAAAEMGTAELPTYDEAVAEGLGSPAVGREEERGHFEVEAQHLMGAESWDADEKR